jgi:acyl-CoA hydrolase
MRSYGELLLFKGNGRNIPMEYEKGYKYSSDSYTEVSKLLKYEDINGENRLFGGRLMEWIDETAGICAMRHCGGCVTTAAVDNLQFRKGAYLNDILVLRAKMTYVGRTSMEVRVDVFKEEKSSGMRQLINHSYLVEVCVDADNNPIPVPYGLLPETENDRLEWDGAIKRLTVRKQRREEGF